MHWLKPKAQSWPLSRAEQEKCNAGDVVTFTVPSGSHAGMKGSCVTGVLAPEKVPQRMYNKVTLLEFKIRKEFNRAAMAEMQRPGFFDVPKPDGVIYHDRRDRKVITIDPPKAGDIDDGVYVEKLPNSNYRIEIYISDVGKYVRKGTELDAEAHVRATSVYLTDESVPMLPPEISSGVCSLKAGVDRATWCAEVEIDPEGRIVKSDVYRAIINVRANLTYHEAQDAFEQGCDGATEGLDDQIREFFAASRALDKERERRGQIDLDMPTYTVALGDDAKSHSGDRQMRTTQYPKFEAHRVIENFMLLNNIVKANFIRRAGRALITRTQPAPKEEKIQKLREYLDRVGITLVGDPQKDRSVLRKVINDAASHPLKRNIKERVLRSMEQAINTVDVGALHYALGFLAEYAHISSPIRRVVDLENARQLAIILGHPDGEDAASAEELAPIAKYSIKAENGADGASRRSFDRHAAHAMGRREGEVLSGIVTRPKNDGLFVEIENTGTVGFMHSKFLPPDDYVCDEEAGVLAGATHCFNEGDRIAVEVKKADGLTGSVVFGPAGGKWRLSPAIA